MIFIGSSYFIGKYLCVCVYLLVVCVCIGLSPSVNQRDIMNYVFCHFVSNDLSLTLSSLEFNINKQTNKNSE